ncbi:hypothetical protein [Actinoplanes sp. NPDC051494]|uniref:hypothetical protein n=1 Tax=Actinoplanes sp. NPDC051494 TaxID=3363907 RepID=UPI003798ADB9
MPRNVTTAVAGVVITVCAVAAGAGAAVPGKLGTRDGYEDAGGPVWYWPVWFPIFAVALAATGVFLATRPAVHRPAAAVAAVLAAQIAGRAVVGVRDWFNADGAGVVDMSQHELATVVTVAAGIALAGTVAACFAVALLWREPARGWAALRPRSLRLLVAGAVVAVGVPGVIALAGSDAIMLAGTVALTAALPWGGGLAAAAWLGPRARKVTVRTVLACAATTVLTFPVTMLYLMVSHGYDVTSLFS